MMYLTIYNSYLGVAVDARDEGIEDDYLIVLFGEDEAEKRRQ